MAFETSEDYFQYYTQKAGDIVRQLGLAGVAIVWVFHISLNQPGLDSQAQFEPALLWILLLIALGLLFDVLQYVIGSVLWKIEWRKDCKKSAIECSRPINASLWFITVKLTVMILAYILLAVFFLRNFA